MNGTRYSCCDEHRLEDVRAHPTLTGIEYLEVVDDPFQVFAACGDSIELGTRLERKDLPAVAAGGAALAKHKFPYGRHFERGATLGAIYFGEKIRRF